MNRYVLILGIIVILMALGFWYLFFPRSTPQAPVEQPPIVVPNNSSTVTVPAQTVEAVRATFQTEVAEGHPDNIVANETIVVGDWALQLWKGDIMGGEALLKHDPSRGQWTVLDIGGGAWSIQGLMLFEVPRDTAEALLTARPY